MLTEQQPPTRDVESDFAILMWAANLPLPGEPEQDLKSYLGLLGKEPTDVSSDRAAMNNDQLMRDDQAARVLGAEEKSARIRNWLLRGGTWAVRRVDLDELKAALGWLSMSDVSDNAPIVATVKALVHDVARALHEQDQELERERIAREGAEVVL
jgi:hypothetical protein